MNHQFQYLLNEVGQAILDDRSSSLYKNCADWISENEIKNFLQTLKNKELEIRETFSDIEIGAADSYEVDDNICTLAELKADGVQLPPEVTENNFLAWGCLVIYADGGEWSLGEVWCAAVTEGTDCKIGYLLVEDPD
ncbi:MAG: hypothetical protein RI580_00705 [Halothece sp. Uz-M2-17]|nr:hypothetical protein [Halothece sp. Uz-M2-17]